jgi:hypothetical protein
MDTEDESMNKLRFLAGIAALFRATGTAHAMPHDLSNTWCAEHIPESAMIGRVQYYAWIEKCHRRRGTKPCWGLIGWADERDLKRCGTNAKRRFEFGIVPLPRRDPRDLEGVPVPEDPQMREDYRLEREYRRNRTQCENGVQSACKAIKW